MKIAVLGAGAMGMLIGGMLSTANEVTLVDIDSAVVEKILSQGVVIREKDGACHTVFPSATADTTDYAPVELIIVFVKAMYSRGALEANKALIGPGTYLMTLQNGSGHEETLLEFADKEHVVIGTTQHNSSICALGEVFHGGSGRTCIGGLSEGSAGLQAIADAFCASGLEADVDANVKKLIWSKMFTNVSASALTGVLQCPLGFIAENKHAWALCKKLVEEAIAVAAEEGLAFDLAEELEAVHHVCKSAPNGYTSIYADLAAGRRTEVDTISGSVVKAGCRSGVDVPFHRFLVEMVHAMEDYKQRIKES